MNTPQIILLLSPLIVAELALRCLALYKLYSDPVPKGGKALWAVLIALVTFLWAGYFLFGRREG